MQTVRISITKLIGLVPGIGLALVALREADDFWLGVSVAVTFLWVGIAIKKAADPRIDGRVSWRGMLAGGSTYLLLCCIPWGPPIIDRAASLLLVFRPPGHRQPQLRITWIDAGGNLISSTDLYGAKAGRPVESGALLRSLTVKESGSAIGNAASDKPGGIIVRASDPGQFRSIAFLEVGFCIALVAGLLTEWLSIVSSKRDAAKSP